MKNLIEKTKRIHRKSFTLIELIAVIVVIGILAAIVIPNISSFKEEAELTSVVNNARSLQVSVDMFMLKNNHTPTKTKPSLGVPQTLEIYALRPDYIRNTPDNQLINWWLDYNKEVRFSFVDAPSKVHLLDNGNMVGKLSWNSVKDAVGYNIYSAEKNMKSNVSKSAKLQFVKDINPTPNEIQEYQVSFKEEITYFVSAVDEFGFETPAIKVDSDYEHYQQPDKNYVLPSDEIVSPVVEIAPPSKPSYLFFDGNDYVLAPKSPVLDITQNFTIEAKITPITLDSGGNSINPVSNIVSTWGSTGVGNASYQLGIKQEKFYVGFYNGSRSAEYTSPKTLKAGETYFVSAVLEESTLKIYIDNVLDVTHTVSVLPQATNYPITIGAEATRSYNFYMGSIHDVRIWNKPLQSNEVQNSSLTNLEDNLILHYDFEKNNDNVVIDRTKNSFNGTIHGATYRE